MRGRGACLSHVVGAEEEVDDVGVMAELTHDLHHVDALPQRARLRRTCQNSSSTQSPSPGQVRQERCPRRSSHESTRAKKLNSAA